MHSNTDGLCLVWDLLVVPSLKELTTSLTDLTSSVSSPLPLAGACQSICLADGVFVHSDVLKERVELCAWGNISSDGPVLEMPDIKSLHNTLDQHFLSLQQNLLF